MSKIVYLNGAFLPVEEARISPFDRGFLFGDGIYEVVAFLGDMPLGLEAHMERLERSLAEIEIPAPMPMDELAGVIKRMRTHCPAENATVYLQVSRGAGEKRSHSWQEDLTPTVFAQSSGFERQTMDKLEQGFAVITQPDIRWLRCDIKSIALLPATMAAKAAQRAGVLETVLHRDGMLTECSSSNVFIVRNGKVETPQADNRILNGIHRQFALRAAQRAGIEVREQDVPLEALAAADEVFVTSTTREIAPVVEVDGKPVGDGKVGPVWRALRAAYDAEINALMKAAA